MLSMTQQTFGTDVSHQPVSAFDGKVCPERHTRLVCKVRHVSICGFMESCMFQLPS